MIKNRSCKINEKLIDCKNIELPEDELDYLIGNNIEESKRNSEKKNIHVVLSSPIFESKLRDNDFFENLSNY